MGCCLLLIVPFIQMFVNDKSIISFSWLLAKNNATRKDTKNANMVHYSAGIGFLKGTLITPLYVYPYDISHKPKQLKRLSQLHAESLDQCLNHAHFGFNMGIFSHVPRTPHVLVARHKTITRANSLPFPTTLGIIRKGLSCMIGSKFVQKIVLDAEKCVTSQYWCNMLGFWDKLYLTLKVYDGITMIKCWPPINPMLLILTQEEELEYGEGEDAAL
ncbi:hypothetical protein VNO77_18344 [Canavalia gladiata]|uniref:Uncharacterized protein n=1 Tax=Canavalia gladiata TaxID=3824 RepID=A0AAN9QJJ4_CANGL